jgi:hypothetical protein
LPAARRRAAIAAVSSAENARQLPGEGGEIIQPIGAAPRQLFLQAAEQRSLGARRVVVAAQAECGEQALQRHDQRPRTAAVRRQPPRVSPRRCRAR